MWVALETPFVHPNNRSAFIRLAAAAGETVTFTRTLRETMDLSCNLLWIPSRCVAATYFPRAARILYGPHNFVFPQKEWLRLQWKDRRAAYICLSDWVRSCYQARGGAAGLPLVLCPFPVDVERFAPPATAERRGALLYCKQRRRLEIEWARVCLADAGIPVQELHYGSYKEEDYVKALHSVQFCVWVGRAESQGFALQECLAADVPILVWSVEQMGQEIAASGRATYKGVDAAVPAVTAPYWDDRCGIQIRRGADLPAALERLRSGLGEFSPRSFVEETLSPEACLQRWRKEIPGGLV